MQVKSRKVFVIDGKKYKVVSVEVIKDLTIITLETKLKSKSLLVYKGV